MTGSHHFGGIGALKVVSSTPFSTHKLFSGATRATYKGSQQSERRPSSQVGRGPQVTLPGGFYRHHSLLTVRLRSTEEPLRLSFFIKGMTLIALSCRKDPSEQHCCRAQESSKRQEVPLTGALPSRAAQRPSVGLCFGPALFGDLRPS